MHGSELIIRTRNEHQICELIPIHALDGDFPSALVQNYAHFFDINSRRIEWRPLKNIWGSSPDNWQMHLDDQGIYVLSHAEKYLIDIRSPTAKSISNRLSPLEHATYIHISLNGETGRLDVQLPRMKLDFSLENTRSYMKSKQFRGMAVDMKQSFGAFTGLKNKLVLCEVGL